MLYGVGEAVYDEAMNLFNRQNANASGPEEGGSEREAIQQDWRATALRLLITALVVAVVALAAAWALHSAQKSPSPKKTTGTSQGAKAPAKPSTKNQPAKPSTNSGSSTPPKAPAPTGSTAGNGTARGTAPAGNQLTNTGPGDTIALFAVTTAAASGLYYLVILRRLSGQN